MRILLYAINHAPEVVGVGKYMGEMAAWLATEGHEVRVIAAPPYYPAWRVAEGHRAWRYGHERRDGALVYRCPLYVPRQPSAPRRLLHLACFALTSLPVALWLGLVWRPDVIFVVEPTLACAPAAWLAARLAGAVAWLHVQDFETDVAFELGLLGGGLARRAVSGAERLLMRRFDAVSTISPRMAGRLAEKGVPEHRIALFKNWLDADAIRPLDGPSPMRAELAIDHATIVALYAGNMGEKQGLETVIAAARLLAERQDILLVLAGEGAARARLESAAGGLANLLFLPLQPSERLNDLLNLADVHLLPQRGGAADLVMPSKLIGMLGSGRPVIAGAVAGTEIAAVLDSRGLMVAPDDARAMAGAIEVLADDRDRRLALGRAARDYAVAELDKRAILDGFGDRLEALVKTAG